MSDEYPKALYRGDTKSYEHVIADHEEHEAQLREAGYVHYSELKEPEIVVVGKVSGSSGELKKVQEELLEALKKSKFLEEQLATAQGEYISQINALKKENDTYKYSAMDAGELRTILDEKGIKYGSRDGKEVLVSYVLESLYPKEGE
ncbi:hypothetical protein IC794_06330 [Acinetobacter seifertii]|uniref:hypothetical protein n=1 Tax=Acinetobacter seifertii TaxID=1530123 RepID=UPI00168BA492|nr:hypothetical protein [Acinetobacter seifertii]QNX13380.1 hypothetical protein IC794_06330 [Acinetobacter seifertii]QNX99949.1 hypothetical protein IC770_06330 [Acinetobacter seifertii]QNY03821.1 hypothetical protein IC768_06330 [Acinetobacter seifertii]QNY03874.1 hypothetical protein IC768_06620 [Acinetobacter seifertii]